MTGIHPAIPPSVLRAGAFVQGSRTALHARETIAQEEQRLCELVEAKDRPSVLTLEGLIETYFELSPRKVSDETIARDRISARNLLRIIGKNTQSGRRLRGVLPQRTDGR